MAEPIEIIIRKGEGGEGTGFGIPSMPQASGRGTAFGTEESFLKEKTIGDKYQAAAIAFGLATLKKAINYGISQYGNQTGNYISQSQTQALLDTGMTGLGIGMSFVTGTLVGGPVMGALMGGLALANSAINIGFQQRTLQINIDKLNTYSNIQRERSGNVYNNGSRGTDY